MQILQFRPYKKWDKEQLIAEIDRVSQQMDKLAPQVDQGLMEYLNQLFSEARKREVTLGTAEYCKRILYHQEE